MLALKTGAQVFWSDFKQRKKPWKNQKFPKICFAKFREPIGPMYGTGLVTWDHKATGKNLLKFGEKLQKLSWRAAALQTDRQNKFASSVEHKKTSAPLRSTTEPTHLGHISPITDISGTLEDGAVLGWFFSSINFQINRSVCRNLLDILSNW